MMKFRTPVRPPQSPFRITPQSRILSLGSCFARHTGDFLRERFFPVSVNPAGTMFNPVSVLRIVRRMAAERMFKEEDLFYHDGMWKSFELYTLFNRPDKNEFLENANSMLQRASQFIDSADTVIVTYGTARVYEVKQTREIAANCHKLPAERFRTRLLETAEIEQAVSELYQVLKRRNPALRFIFSVSPVRYLQDGPTLNTVSKGRLIDAVFDFTRRHPDDTYYFPAYEIFMDDLRGYRFYDTDLVHPGAEGITYALELFTETFFDEEGKILLKDAEKLYKLLQHRPRNASSREERQWVNRKRELAERLRRAYPLMEWPRV